MTKIVKYPNPMRVKASRTYDVLEAARGLGRSPATIRNWIKDGLEVLASKKPFLILGQAIRDYIRSKSASRKSPLASDQLYYLSCRTGRPPRKGQVSVAPQNEKTLRLSGVCETCGSLCSRVISASKAHFFAETFAFKKSVGSEEYVFDPRGLGVEIETITERHNGPFSGAHARYVLHSKATRIEGVPS